MGLAPSEKHLEDWIVANFNDFKQQVNTGFRYIIARQPEFPCGKPDLIVAARGQLFVVELKLGVIDEKAVAQCLRYRGALYDLHEHLEHRYWDEVDNPHNHSVNVRQEWSGGLPIFNCLLVGNSVSPTAEYLMDSHNFRFNLYDFNGQSYTFHQETTDNLKSIDCLIGSATEIGMREFMRHLKIYQEDRTALKEIYDNEVVS